MNRNSPAIVSLIVAALIILIVSAAAYGIGGKLAEMFIFVDAQKAGINPPLPDVWKKSYAYLVINMGLGVGAVLLLWTALTHWGLRSEGSRNQGKLWLWLFFEAVVIAICVGGPYLFVNIFSLSFDNSLLTDYRISVLFFICYGLIGYWGGSIITTSDRYKYTPLLSGFFH